MVGAEATTRCGVCGNTVAANMVVQLGGKTVCMTCKSGYAREMAGARPVGAVRYAGFWIRLVAVFLDGIFLMVPMVLLIVLFAGAMIATERTDDGRLQASAQGLFYLVYYGGMLFYSTFFHGKFGATPGKMICRIKVLNSNGSTIGFGRAFGRYFAHILSGLICYVGYIIAAFDPEKRALHDRICDTRVVYK